MLTRSRKFELPNCVAICDWNPHSPPGANLNGEEPSLTGGAIVKVQISTDDVKRHQLLGVGCAGRGGRFSEISQPFQKHVQLLASDGAVFCRAEPQRPNDEAAARPQPGPSQALGKDPPPPDKCGPPDSTFRSVQVCTGDVPNNSLVLRCASHLHLWSRR